tara:strand:+ start:69721 stop:69903 length:183 start_codon:yes stop_codon:yes gene_type:complete
MGLSDMGVRPPVKDNAGRPAWPFEEACLSQEVACRRVVFGLFGSFWSWTGHAQPPRGVPA